MFYLGRLGGGDFSPQNFQFSPKFLVPPAMSNVSIMMPKAINNLRSLQEDLIIFVKLRLTLESVTFPLYQSNFPPKIKIDKTLFPRIAI